MPARSLPARPNLEQYRKQAKALLAEWKRADPSGRRRLAEAQFAIARDHGFDTWKAFADEIARRTGATAAAEIWKAAEDALVAGDAATLERLLGAHATLLRAGRPQSSWPGGLAPDYTTGDARTIVARTHGFARWQDFAAFRDALTDGASPIRRFERAVDAIVAGDTEALARLLREQPDLVRARSGRTHRATLLHYLGANGVEPWRQRTPDNAAQIAAALLAAGADIEARANLYGGSSTTLGLLATSIHPKNARLLAPLLDLFLAHGARVDAGEGARSLVAACLANGRLEAAELLAARGAPLDLEAAAGLGRLDRVAGFFTATGALVPPATADQELAAFMWACEYGRTDVVEFLLDRGVDVSGRAGPHQQTGLHWAAHSGHVATVQALLRRRPGLEATDASFHGTPLAWAVHAWKERRNDPGRREPCYLVAELLVAAGAKAGAAGLDADEVRSDPRMLAILTRGREGAHPPKRGPRDRRGGSAP